MTDSQEHRHIFQEGAHALIIDRKGRRYLVRLRSSATFQSHIGNFKHADLIGREEGSWITTALGHQLLAVKPTLAEFTCEMPRIATIIYPKDLGAILVYGDIFPGARVLEAGAGSGSMTMALMRAIGEHGQLFSYDIRADMIERTVVNVGTMFSRTTNFSIKLGDVYQGFQEDNLDRIILDLPEPWHVVPHAANSLVPGGIFLSFLPTVLQVHQLTLTLREQGGFDLIETVEIMIRSWSVGERSVRPSHRMIGHTGFITTAHKCSPRPTRSPDHPSPT